MQTNIVVGLWLGVFAIMTAADVAAALTAEFSFNIAMTTGLVALAEALTFSVCYSARARQIEPI